MNAHAQFRPPLFKGQLHTPSLVTKHWTYTTVCTPLEPKGLWTPDSLTHQREPHSRSFTPPSSTLTNIRLPNCSAYTDTRPRGWRPRCRAHGQDSWAALTPGPALSLQRPRRYGLQALRPHSRSRLRSVLSAWKRPRTTCKPYSMASF